MFEYLLSRKTPGRSYPNVQKDPMAAVLSFQRRNTALKDQFLRQGVVTPAGLTTDTWDRTEAQKRFAPHSHILAWFRRRLLPPSYVRNPTVPLPKAAENDATSPGASTPASKAPTGPRPRVPPADRKEDHMYYHSEIARVNGTEQCNSASRAI